MQPGLLLPDCAKAAVPVVLLAIKEKVTTNSNIPNTLTFLTLFGRC